MYIVKTEFESTVCFKSIESVYVYKFYALRLDQKIPLSVSSLLSLYSEEEI